VLSSNVRASPVAPNEITLIDRRKGAIAVVSKAWDRGVEAPLRWSDDASAIYCLAQDRARPAPVSLRPGVARAHGAGEGRMVTEFAAADAIAFIRDDHEHPASVYAKRGDGGSARRSRSTTALRRFQLGASEEVGLARGGAKRLRCGWCSRRASTRREVPGWHSIHGGPHAISADTWHFRWNNHGLRGAGLHRRLRQFPRLVIVRPRNSSSPFA